MADPSVNMDMSTFDEFYRDNLGDQQTTLQTKSLSQDKAINTNSSINQTRNGNASQNSIAVPAVILNSQGNTTSDNGTVKLSASGMQDKRLSTLAFNAFNNNMF
jgi:hypothetical protein